MISLVQPCGHWHRIPCLDESCDIERTEPEPECSQCQHDDEWHLIWLDERLDEQLAREAQTIRC